jgi:hypothetical protein
MVSTDQFREEIRSQLQSAVTHGDSSLIVDSSELYRSVSKLPTFDPWMIFCCNAMRAEMTAADHLIFNDEKDTLLTVNYKLPREPNGPRGKSR